MIWIVVCVNFRKTSDGKEIVAIEMARIWIYEFMIYT